MDGNPLALECVEQGRSGIRGNDGGDPGIEPGVVVAGGQRLDHALQPAEARIADDVQDSYVASLAPGRVRSTLTVIVSARPHGTQGLKRAALALLSAPGVTAPFYPFMHGHAAIFMLHRFAMPDLGVEGTDPGAVRQALELLRRRKFNLIGLGDLFRRLREGPPPSRAVAFTIDDGYLDHAEIAAPAFAAYDCPVTTFVTTGFLDRTVWFWWDRIEYILRATARRSLHVPAGSGSIDLEWNDEPGRRRITASFTDRCKALRESEKLAAIGALAAAAEVDVPAAAPPACAPMSWDQLRSCEKGGMSFGAHTLTHPILARCDDDQSRREIAGSWERLGQETRQPIPVFCYPNGGWTDFGPREIATLRDLRFDGAVVGAWGLADAGAVRRDPDEAFRARHFGFPSDRANLIQYVSGVERIKIALRQLAS